MKLYNLRSTPTGFAIASFDEDFNLLAAYSLTPATRGSGYTCDCPANNRTVITSLCRHRKMLPLLMGAVNTNRFYNHDTGGWVELGEGHDIDSGPHMSEVPLLKLSDPSIINDDWRYAAKVANVGASEASEELIEGAGIALPTECQVESTSSLGEIEGPGHPSASLIKNSILDDLKFVEVDSAHSARDSASPAQPSASPSTLRRR